MKSYKTNFLIQLKFVSKIETKNCTFYSKYKVQMQDLKILNFTTFLNCVLNNLQCSDSVLGQLNWMVTAIRNLILLYYHVCSPTVRLPLKFYISLIIKSGLLIKIFMFLHNLFFWLGVSIFNIFAINFISSSVTIQQILFRYQVAS